MSEKFVFYASRPLIAELNQLYPEQITLLPFQKFQMLAGKAVAKDSPYIDVLNQGLVSV